MTVIVLCAAIVLQSLVILYQAFAQRRERDELLDRIMCRDLTEYRQKDGAPPGAPRRTPYSKVREAWRSPGGKDDA